MRVFRRWAPSLSVRWLLEEEPVYISPSLLSSSSLHVDPLHHREPDSDHTQKEQKTKETTTRKQIDSLHSTEPGEQEKEEAEALDLLDLEKKDETGSTRIDCPKEASRDRSVLKSKKKAVKERTSHILVITYEEFLKFGRIRGKSVDLLNGFDLVVFDTRHPHSTSPASCSCAASSSSSAPQVTSPSPSLPRPPPPASGPASTCLSSSSGPHPADPLLCHEESLLYRVAEIVDASMLRRLPQKEKEARKEEAEEKEEKQANEVRGNRRTDEDPKEKSRADSTISGRKEVQEKKENTRADLDKEEKEDDSEGQKHLPCTLPQKLIITK